MGELDNLKVGDIIKIEGGSMTFHQDLLDWFKWYEAKSEIPVIKDGTIGFDVILGIYYEIQEELNDLKEKIAQVKLALE